MLRRNVTGESKKVQNLMKEKGRERYDLGGVGRGIFKILLYKTGSQLSLVCVTLWVEIRSSVCLVCVYVRTVNTGPF